MKGGYQSSTGPTRRATVRALAWRLLAVLLLAVLASPGHAKPNYPSFSGPVVDSAGVLSGQQRVDLARKLLDLQKSTGVQFAVATVPSLEGLEIEPYANGLFREWKIGEKGVNNGLLLLLAPKERKLRFEIGYGLEGAFTDLQSKLILRNTMVPKLKADDPSGALKAGADDAILVLTKDKAALPARLQPSAAAKDGDALLGFLIIGFIVLLIVIVIASSRFRRGRATWGPAATGGFIGGGASDFGGGASSSSGGDGFSGGGGGDSGGGGSSDSY